MKVFATVIGLFTVAFSQFSNACVPLNRASFDTAFVNKATASKAYLEELYQLGAGSESRIKSIHIESPKRVRVELSSKCEILVTATPVEAKNGEPVCMNFDFDAKTFCQAKAE